MINTYGSVQRGSVANVSVGECVIPKGAANETMLVDSIPRPYGAVRSAYDRFCKNKYPTLEPSVQAVARPIVTTCYHCGTSRPIYKEACPQCGSSRRVK